MKNNKNTKLAISYILTKKEYKNGCMILYSFEVFCYGSGNVMITRYSYKRVYDKIKASLLNNTILKGGYKLAHRLYENSKKHYNNEQIETYII